MGFISVWGEKKQIKDGKINRTFWQCCGSGMIFFGSDPGSGSDFLESSGSDPGSGFYSGSGSCMNTYTHTQLSTHIHTYMHTNTQTYTYTNTHTYTHAHTHYCLYVTII
jgi:hypothetical protein